MSKLFWVLLCIILYILLYLVCLFLNKIGIYSLNKNSIYNITNQTQSLNLNPKVHGTQLYIWGQLASSSLGFGNNDQDIQFPKLIDDIDGSGYIDASLGNNHCGIVTGNGDVYVFGSSNYGELGLGEDIHVSSLSSVFSNKKASGNLINKPTKINELRNIVKISFGAGHSAAIDDDGNLYTWGWAGYKFGACGGLGHGDKQSLNKPKKVESLGI